MKRRRKLFRLRWLVALLFILAMPERTWDALGDRYSRIPPRPSRAVEVFDGRGV